VDLPEGVDAGVRVSGVSWNPRVMGARPAGVGLALGQGLGLDGVSPVLLTEDSLQVAVAWRTEAPPVIEYKSYVHLVDPEGTRVAQDDVQPAEWGAPATGWQPDQSAWITYRLALPEDLPAGEYRLYTGLYDPVTLTRVETLPGAVSTDEHGLPIGRVRIGD
jgi:hypothetical protein